MPNENRYAKDWNEYSRMWDQADGARFEHLGDEWADCQRDTYYFDTFAKRFLRPDMTVMEVGVGGGKYTHRLAALVKRVIAFDVAEEMLTRTRTRCESLGLHNIEYVLGNGKDFQPVADASVDFFFSFDVFVHIALEDTWPYAQEIARVLVPGGHSSVHYAIGSCPDAWDRIEQVNPWYRAGHTAGQYYYYSPEMLRRMYERVGLQVREVIEFWCQTTLIACKPRVDIIPRLEQTLRRLMTDEAADDRVRAELVGRIRSLARELEPALEPLLTQLQNEADRGSRSQPIARLRSIWRGGIPG